MFREPPNQGDRYNPYGKKRHFHRWDKQETDKLYDVALFS
jgi:hypothetical protein